MASQFFDNVFKMVVGIGFLLSWFTHIFTCFAEGLWGFLLAGAIMFPIGVFHGFYLWFK